MPTVSDLLAIALQHHQSGRLLKAEQTCRQIIATDPNNADGWKLLGALALELGKADEAVTCSEQAVQLKPDWVEAYYNLGIAYHAKGERAKAIASLRRAVELNPGYIDALHSLGLAFNELGNLDQAAVYLHRVIELKPGSPEALNALGSIFHRRNRLHEAADCYRRAIDQNPESAEANYNLGLVFKESAKIDDAEVCFERAIALRPDFAEAHVNRSMISLARGELERGWAQYEWRWKTGQLPVRKFDQPCWNGESLVGKRILIYCEQGLGDSIQLVRYAPLLKSQGATVIVECQPALKNLLATCEGIDHLIGEGDQAPEFDFHLPFLSLPRVLRTSLANLPANTPYLFADKSLVSYWRSRLDTTDSFLVGVNWRGRRENPHAHQRDIPLPQLATLAQTPRVRLISLQKALDQAERRALGNAVEDLGEIDAESGPFMDTAAIMKNLDLVITSDTSVAHLAGALGVPVWVALPFVPDWRWLLDRNDSPWYPTMRLFRQKSRGDWASVFNEISIALRTLLNAR